MSNQAIHHLEKWFPSSTVLQSKLNLGAEQIEVTMKIPGDARTVTNLKVLGGRRLIDGHTLPGAGDENLHRLEEKPVSCRPEQSLRGLTQCYLKKY